MNPLRTDYKNDELKPSMNGKRHYDIYDSDGVTKLYSDVIMEDVSEYDVHGDIFGKDDINAMNAMANQNYEDNKKILDIAPNLDQKIEEANEISSELSERLETAQSTIEEIQEAIPEGYNELVSKVDDCFTSVSNGKTLIASAITDKGIITSYDATFYRIAKNIELIKTGSGNATTDNVLEGKTFSSDDGSDLVGTMPNFSNTTVMSEGVTQDDDYTYVNIPNAGYYDENSKIAHVNSTSSGKNYVKIVRQYAYYDRTNGISGTIIDVQNVKTVSFNIAGTFATNSNVFMNTSLPTTNRQSLSGTTQAIKSGLNTITIPSDCKYITLFLSSKNDIDSAVYYTDLTVE